MEEVKSNLSSLQISGNDSQAAIPVERNARQGATEDMETALDLPTVCAAGSVDPSTSKGATLWSSKVNPRGLASTRVSRIAYLSGLFSQWRGSIRVSIVFTKVIFQQTKLVLAYDPAARDPKELDEMQVDSLPSLQYSVIINPANDNEVHFDIPFICPSTWCSMHDSCGCISLRVLQPLVSTQGSTEAIYWTLLVSRSKSDPLMFRAVANPPAADAHPDRLTALQIISKAESPSLGERGNSEILTATVPMRAQTMVAYPITQGSRTPELAGSASTFWPFTGKVPIQQLAPGINGGYYMMEPNHNGATTPVAGAMVLCKVNSVWWLRFLCGATLTNVGTLRAYSGPVAFTAGTNDEYWLIDDSRECTLDSLPRGQYALSVPVRPRSTSSVVISFGCVLEVLIYIGMGSSASLKSKLIEACDQFKASRVLTFTPYKKEHTEWLFNMAPSPVLNVGFPSMRCYSKERLALMGSPAALEVAGPFTSLVFGLLVKGLLAGLMFFIQELGAALFRPNSNNVYMVSVYDPIVFDFDDGITLVPKDQGETLSQFETRLMRQYQAAPLMRPLAFGRPTIQLQQPWYYLNGTKASSVGTWNENKQKFE